jgi:hypothetical protein
VRVRAAFVSEVVRRPAEGIDAGEIPANLRR